MLYRDLVQFDPIETVIQPQTRESFEQLGAMRYWCIMRSEVSQGGCLSKAMDWSSPSKPRREGCALAPA
jgi:hypothetical protein